MKVKANLTKEMAPVLQRLINAENNFVEIMMDTANCTKEQAQKVLRVYRTLKVIKLDVAMGRYTFKCGAFLEVDVIQNAINYAE
jgi:hypothetical protein